MIPNYYTFLDWTANLSGRLKTNVRAKLSRKTTADPSLKGQPPASKMRDKILDEALDRYENIVGRFDTLGKVPSRTLLAPQTAEEAVWLEQQGAKLSAKGEWVVPEGVPLEPFENWFPDVPLDLRDKTPRYLKTRNGRSVASYVEASDRAKGGDSTATSLLYGAFPLIAAVAFFASSISPGLGYLVALLFVPFTIALSQAEGPLEGAKGLVMLGLLPLTIALSVVSGGRGASVMGLISASVEERGIAGLGAFVLPFVILVLIALAGSFIVDRFDKNKSASVIGGGFQKFKSMMLWAIVYAAAFLLSQMLPLFLQPVFYFGLAGIYPMFYTNANYVRRAKLLYRQSKHFNMDRMGSLASAHIAAKNKQALRAFEDKTPLFKVGTAMGWLTKKHYAYAPDAGTVMVISALDATKHMLCFGETGIGKSTVIARPMAKQWWESKRGGLLVLDGKGALPGDLSGIIQVMITPGVNFAPLQGLDGHGISTALNSIGKSTGNDKDAFWAKGASTFIVHACQLFEALNRHEKTYRQYAANKVSLLSLDIDEAEVEIEIAERSGGDTSELHARLQAARRDLGIWLGITEAPRKWLWNVVSLIKVFNMINKPIKNSKGEWEPSALLRETLQFLGYQREGQSDPATIYPQLGKGGIFDGAISYILDTWTPTEPQQRSSYWGNIEKRITPITEGKYLLGENDVHWMNLEEGVDAKACLYGGSVGVHLPEEMHQEAGLLITALVNQLINSNIALRGSNPKWREDGQKPLMKIVDECQDLVGDSDRQLLPKARSLEMTGCYLTQGFESLITKFGDPMKATQFANTFQNLVCLRSSPQTYEYMRERLGTADLLTYTQKAHGIDMDGGVRALAASALNDEEHPDRSALRKMERQGAGRLSVMKAVRGGFMGQRMIELSDDEISDDIRVPTGGELKEQPLFKPSEFDALLTSGNAIVLLNRAGERRVDICEMFPVHADELRKDD